MFPTLYSPRARARAVTVVCLHIDLLVPLYLYIPVRLVFDDVRGRLCDVLCAERLYALRLRVVDRARRIEAFRVGDDEVEVRLLEV